MTQSGDDLALLHNLAADGADFVAGVAVLGAGGSLGTHQLDLVTQSGDDLALGDDLAAGLADHVAGVAILGAGGGLGVHGLGLGVQVSSQSLGVVHGLIVALGLGNGDVDLVQSGGILDGEGQGGHGGTGGHAVEVHIAQGDLAGSILVGAVLGVEGHVGQGQVGGIVIHGEQAVGGSILGQDVDGDGLLIRGHGDVGGGGVLSSVAHGQVHHGSHGGSGVQGALGSLGLGAVVALDLSGGHLHSLSGVDGGLAHGSVHGLGGVLIGVVHGAHQGGRPHAVAEVADVGSFPLTSVLIQEDAVDMAGVAGEVGQVQNQLLALDGGVQGVIQVAVIGGVGSVANVSQVGLDDAEGGAPGVLAGLLILRGINIHGPDVAGVIQRQEQLGVGILHAVVIGVDLVGTQRGNGGEVGSVGKEPQIQSEVEGGQIQVIHRLGRQEVGGVHAGQHGLGLGGVNQAVLHIPHGDFALEAGIGSQGLTGIQVHLVDVEAAILQIDVAGAGVEGGGRHALGGFEVHQLLPGGVVLHIPGVELGIAVGIHQRAHQGGVHGLDGDHAGGGGGGILDGGRRDGGSTLVDAGDDAALVDGGDSLIGGLPGHAIGLHAEGADLSVQSSSAALVHLDGLLIQSHGHGAAELFLVEVDLVGGGVVGVVGDLNQQVVNALGLAQIQGDIRGSALGSTLGGAGGAVQNGHLVIVDQEGGRHIAVVLSGQDQAAGAGLNVFLEVHVGQDRLGPVDESGVGPAGTIAQGIPVGGGIALGIVGHIVLGSLSDLDGDLLTLSSLGGGIVDTDVALSIAPAAAVAVVVSASGGRTGRLIIVDSAVLAGDGRPGIRSVADQGEGSTGKDGGIRVDGGAVGIIGLIHVRIAAEVVHAGIASVLDGQGLILGGVLVVGVHVGHTGLGLGLMILQIAADIKHGGIGPAAVVAQDGNGVAVALDTLGGGNLVGVHITLDIGAGVVAGLVILVQAQDLGIDFHMDAAVCGDLHGALVQLLEEQVSIVGVDVAVVVEVGVVLIGDGIQDAGDIVQERLAVGLGDLAVAIEVAVGKTLGSGHLHHLAVHGPGDIGGQVGGPGVLEVHHGAVLELIGEDILGEEVGAEVEGGRSILQVVDGEAEVILAGAGGIVAQLHLDLTVGSAGVGVLIHLDVGAGGNGSAHIGKAGALLHNGIVAILALAVILIHGDSGGHQQGLSQSTGGEAGLLRQLVGADVLGHHSGHTGNLGRGHGGTGHILVAAAILQGVDIAARSGDLRLQLQGAGNAPGGEVAHGVVAAVVDRGAGLGTNGHLAGVIHQAGISGVLLGVGLDGLAVGLGHGDAGLCLGVVAEVHVDGASLVVDDDGGNGTGSHSVLALLIEGDGTAVAQADLALEQVGHGGEVFLRAAGIHVHELMLTGNGGHGQVGIAGGLAVDLLVAGHFDEVAGSAVVIHGGDAQRVGVGAGAAVGGPADALGVGIGIGGVLEPVAGVTGGHGNDHAAVDNSLQDGLVLGVGLTGIAGVAAAQRQVGGIAAQDHGVLDGGHVVGVVSAAALTEDLHGVHLGIRGNTLGQGGIQSGSEGPVGLLNVAVAGGNTGDVGAVVTLLVVVVGDIQIGVNVVEAEGDLGADIQVLSLQVALLLEGVELLQLVSVIRSGDGGDAQALDSVAVGSAVEGGVIGVSAGINDGHLGACAGVTVSPGNAGADHGGGGSHVGVGGLRLLDHARLILRLDQDGINTLDLLDLLDLAILNVGGDDVGGQGQIPNHIQRLAVQGLLGDGLGHLILLGFQLVAILHRLFAARGDVGRGKALVQGGGVAQHDGDADHVRVGILLLGFFLNSRVFLDGQLDVVHFFPGDTVVLALGRNGAAAHGPGGGHETQRQYEGKHHGHRPFEGMRVFHMRTLSFSGLYR